jgi:hypothetical protein
MARVLSQNKSRGRKTIGIAAHADSDAKLGRGPFPVKAVCDKCAALQLSKQKPLHNICFLFLRLAEAGTLHQVTAMMQLQT